MEEQNTTPEPDTQCAMCGRVPGPYDACGVCHGRGGIEKRTYTLSEIRSGRAPKEDRSRDSGKPLGPSQDSPFWFSA